MSLLDIQGPRRLRVGVAAIILAWLAAGCGAGGSPSGFGSTPGTESQSAVDGGDDATVVQNTFYSDSGFPGFLFGDGGLVEASCTDAAVTCLPGTYIGDFGGTIDLFSLFMIPISGTVDLTLSSQSKTTTKQTGSGEFEGTCTTTTLSIQNGHVHGQDNNNPPNYYAADIGGTLDCPSKKIINGYLANGTYQIGDAGGLGGLLPPAVFHFQGPFTGNYMNQTPPSLTGTWGPVQVVGTNDGGTAAGTWSAKHQ
jgi:hypothetical protein